MVHPTLPPGRRQPLSATKAPETLWAFGMLSVFGILIAGYLFSRSRTIRWPLAACLVAAGGLFVALASYALDLSTYAG